MGSQGHERLFQNIARQLSRRIAGDPAYRIPPIIRMAEEFGVSYRTMWKAVGLLADEGKIARWKGRRVALHPANNPDTGRDTPVRRLFAKIKDRILNGSYVVDEALPKFDHLISEERVSRFTISAGMRRLSEAGLIHKRGRQWIVGPQRRRPFARAHAGDRSPIAILLTNDEYSAYKVFSGAFFASFVNQFNTELIKQGIRLVFMHYNPPLNPESIMPWGMEAARACIRSCGDRYCGALIADIFPTIDTYRPWTHELSQEGKKPVVYFDTADVGSRITREKLGLKSGFFRLHFDETATVEAALRTLAAAGHTHIAFSTFKEYRSWSDRRYDLAVDLARRNFPGLKITPHVHDEPFWDPSGETDVDKIATFTKQIEEYMRGREARASAPARRSRPQRIRAHTPSVDALLNSGATAVMAANDRLAHLLWLWCTAAGVDIPGRLSVISFDNIPESIYFPITTVDFGFARLGYLAAHILIGDVPVKCDAKGAIPALPILIERGSVMGGSGSKDA
jgi:DNA-binding LacI/PurR family transcriptional regulator/DNA-binding transcriptional regulator YhcF (GntR family)